MRTVHIFRVTDDGQTKHGDSACGEIVNVNWRDVTDCIADHKAENVCRRCVKKQVADLHKFPALVGAS